jgi:hypothetical protein
MNSDLGRLWGNPGAMVSDMAAPTNASPIKLLPERVAAVLESETEDEREERDLLIRRHRAEQIADPEQRQVEIERLQQEETHYRNRLARRQRDEMGADLFYFPRLKEQLLRDGWCQLFDGHTSFGWKIQDEGNYGGGKFTFGNHEISSDPFHPGLVYTQIPFGDISLRFDYWAEKDSEVFLLLKTPPDPADLNSSCYTFVLNSSRSNRPRGLLLGRHGLTLAELRSMRLTWDNPANEEEGTWHSVVVKIEGNNLQFWLDNRIPITYFDEKPIRSGHIAFLVAKGKARFQNILWQPNQTVAIFDTENRMEESPPWRVSERGDFAGHNDTTGFHLLAGSVESKDVYDNYVLQMQYRQGHNSGQSSLFIRALPHQENSGYEISLQNFPRRKDRETARGVDAGGFLQIKDARYIRAQDQQWTYLTVAAMGRQITTWVNGVPVCEIVDRRRAQEHAPTGPFLKPGTVRLSVPQGNSGFQFRHLTISPVQLP